MEDPQLPTNLLLSRLIVNFTQIYAIKQSWLRREDWQLTSYLFADCVVIAVPADWFISAVHTLRMASEPVIEQKGEMHLAWASIFGLLAIFMSATALPVVERSTNGEVFALYRSMTFPKELGDDVDTSDDEIKNLGKCKQGKY